jgi:hypothetical protein
MENLYIEKSYLVPRFFRNLFKQISSLYANEVEKIIEVHIDSSANDWENAPLEYYHFITDKKKSTGNIITARNEFLKNSHLCNVNGTSF